MVVSNTSPRFNVIPKVPEIELRVLTKQQTWSWFIFPITLPWVILFFLPLKMHGSKKITENLKLLVETYKKKIKKATRQLVKKTKHALKKLK